MTGSRVVVDTSKWPGSARLLERIDGVDLAVAHLVRDPRAVAHSRRRSRARTGKPQLSAAQTALQWNVWNAAIEAAWRKRGSYAMLRYEDFVAEPEAAVRRLTALVGEQPAALPFTAPDAVELEPTHSVAGNRNRFDTGSVRIVLDDEWRTRAHDNRLVGALTWPLRARYGY